METPLSAVPISSQETCSARVWDFAFFSEFWASICHLELSSFLRDTLTTGGTAILRGETADDPGLGFAHSVASGLSMCPRRLESCYLYDRQGSAIFDRITE